MNARELKVLLDKAIADYEEARSQNKPLEELRKLMEKVKECREAYNIQKEVEDMKLSEMNNNPAPDNPKKSERTFDEMKEEELEKEYTKSFLRAVRNPKNVTERDEKLHTIIREKRTSMAPSTTSYLKSSVEENGGLIIPKDILTKIHEYKRQLDLDLSTLITVEVTSFTSGERVFEKLETMTPFVAISEWDKIEEIDAPKFEKKTYSMKDYAGILPIPRRLLQDTDQNLMNHLAKFIARKTLLTRNKQILTVLNNIPKYETDIKTVDAIKTVKTVKLDTAFLANATILTNQDGFLWLSTLKDENGNYLMQPDVTQETGKVFDGTPIKVLSNRQLPTNSKKIPFFIGDFKEVAILFDRGVYEVLGTDVGGQAFQRNSYDIRVIDRFDVQAWDQAAVIRAEIDATKKSGKPATDTEGA